MDSVKPANIVANMVQAGAAKARLGPLDLLIRGCLSGALLGFATSLAVGATVQTGQPLVGALIFPVGFVMIVLLGPPSVSPCCRWPGSPGRPTRPPSSPTGPGSSSAT
jgi:formate/nitrite transporter FocA (FNT family)